MIQIIIILIILNIIKIIVNLKMLIKLRKSPKRSQEITKKKEGNFVSVPDQIQF
jgi:hypothetical protein